jgi:uncharacterized membrane protein HdeD (DUF308 family)
VRWEGEENLNPFKKGRFSMKNTQKNEIQDSLRSFAGRVSAKLGDVWWAFMVRGVLAGVLGICALVWPTASLGIITALVGIYCLVDGISGLVGAMRVSDRGSYLLQALFGIVVGVILLAWPRESMRILLIFFGAWALFTGISQIIAARRADDDFTERSSMTTVGRILAVVGLVLIVWPGTGVVTMSWVIAIVLLLIAGLLIFLALRLKRLKEHVAKLTASRPKTG